MKARNYKRYSIGRTGRAGQKGTSLTYFSWDQYEPAKLKFAQELVDAIKEVGQEPPARLMEIAAGRSSNTSRSHYL